MTNNNDKVRPLAYLGICSHPHSGVTNIEKIEINLIRVAVLKSIILIKDKARELTIWAREQWLWTMEFNLGKKKKENL